MLRIAVSPSSSPSQQCSVVISPNLPLLPRFPVSRASTELISQKNTPKHTHFSKWIHMTEMALAADTVRGPWASWPLHVPHSCSHRHFLSSVIQSWPEQTVPRIGYRAVTPPPFSGHLWWIGQTPKAVLGTITRHCLTLFWKLVLQYGKTFL